MHFACMHARARTHTHTHTHTRTHTHSSKRSHVLDMNTKCKQSHTILNFVALSSWSQNQVVGENCDLHFWTLDAKSVVEVPSDRGAILRREMSSFRSVYQLSYSWPSSSPRRFLLITSFPGHAARVCEFNVQKPSPLRWFSRSRFVNEYDDLE